eukprot:1228006-Amphidinium_carterae.1
MADSNTRCQGELSSQALFTCGCELSDCAPALKGATTSDLTFNESLRCVHSSVFKAITCDVQSVKTKCDRLLVWFMSVRAVSLRLRPTAMVKGKLAWTAHSMLALQCGNVHTCSSVKQIKIHRARC